MASFNKSDAGMMRTAYELSAGMLSLVVAIAIEAARQMLHGPDDRTGTQ